MRMPVSDAPIGLEKIKQIKIKWPEMRGELRFKIKQEVTRPDLTMVWQ